MVSESNRKAQAEIASKRVSWEIMSNYTSLQQ